MSEHQSHEDINNNDLLDSHLIKDGLEGKEKVFVWFDSINFSQSEGTIVMISCSFDPIREQVRNSKDERQMKKEVHVFSPNVWMCYKCNELYKINEDFGFFSPKFVR